MQGEGEPGEPDLQRVADCSFNVQGEGEPGEPDLQCAAGQPLFCQPPLSCSCQGKQSAEINSYQTKLIISLLGDPHCKQLIPEKTS